MKGPRRTFLVMAAVAAFVAASSAVAAREDWLSKVPQAARSRTNPLANNPDAPGAGAKLYQHDCASCHGEDGQGRGRRPALATARVQRMTDGELEWLLTNGSMADGMPSWSRLPEAERWQIVRHLRALPLSAGGPRP